LEFNREHSFLVDGLDRAGSVSAVLTEPKMRDLRRAREALRVQWAFLRTEPDLPEDVRAGAQRLEDILHQETFFQYLPEVDRLSRVIEDEYWNRHQAASLKRMEAYRDALEKLRATPGWEELDPETQAQI